MLEVITMMMEVIVQGTIYGLDTESGRSLPMDSKRNYVYAVFDAWDTEACEPVQLQYVMVNNIRPDITKPHKIIRPEQEE